MRSVDGGGRDVTLVCDGYTYLNGDHLSDFPAVWLLVGPGTRALNYKKRQ